MPRLSSLDVPVEGFGIVPIRGPLNAVLGASYARFYHHPIPMLGLLWDISSALRLEAIYPEPAFIWTPNKIWKLQLYSELVGGGFEANAAPGRTAV
jgi:hypothetical protein